MSNKHLYSLSPVVQSFSTVYFHPVMLLDCNCGGGFTSASFVASIAMSPLQCMA